MNPSGRFVKPYVTFLSQSVRNDTLRRCEVYWDIFLAVSGENQAQDSIYTTYQSYPMHRILLPCILYFTTLNAWLIMLEDWRCTWNSTRRRKRNPPTSGRI